MLSAHKALKEKFGAVDKEYLKSPWYTIMKALYIVTGILLPLLPLNILGLAFLQRKVNQAYTLEAQKEEA